MSNPLAWLGVAALIALALIILKGVWDDLPWNRKREEEEISDLEKVWKSITIDAAFLRFKPRTTERAFQIPRSAFNHLWLPYLPLDLRFNTPNHEDAAEELNQLLAALAKEGYRLLVLEDKSESPVERFTFDRQQLELSGSYINCNGEECGRIFLFEGGETRQRLLVLQPRSD